MQPTFFEAEAYSELNRFLKRKNPSIIFILVDQNTQQFCLPKFLQKLETEVPLEIIEIEAGEEQKTLETCEGIWKALTELDADRKSLLINLGGGVITDLGGFVASNFKRGIDFINVPTSLLAMVDAAIGGKTGVDLSGLKNQIGVFSFPKLLVIDPSFLATLPQVQLRSGLAEMLKHGLVFRKSYWEKMKDLSQLTSEDLPQLIEESVAIKLEIVEIDPKEKGIRKVLNFGHTLGHAIETFFLLNENKPTLLHGEAIAVGMILETFLSTEICGFPKRDLAEIKNSILQSFPKIIFEETDFKSIMNLLKHDKKNSHGNINFVLLEEIGKPKIDITVKPEQIVEAFRYYKNG